MWGVQGGAGRRCVGGCVDMCWEMRGDVWGDAGRCGRDAGVRGDVWRCVEMRGEAGRGVWGCGEMQGGEGGAGRCREMRGGAGEMRGG